MAQTSFVLPWDRRRSAFRVTSQRRMVWSALAEASVWPSGEKARLATQPLCPASRNSVPPATFQT